ncbi:AMP-binding protein, partial [Streptomyces mirabilis]
MPPDTPTRLSLAQGLLERAGSDAVMVRVLAADGSAPAAWSYRDLTGAALALATQLQEQAQALGRPARVGLLAENSPEWVAADLAALFAGAVEIPVPTAFTAQQAASLLQSADLCLTDAAGEAALARWRTSTPQPVLPDGCPAVALDLPALPPAPPPPPP